MEQGFTEGHTTRDVEDLGLADFFENAFKKPSITVHVPDKKKRAMEKLVAFTYYKAGGEITLPARKGKENTIFKVTVRQVAEVSRIGETVYNISDLTPAAKIASMISDYHES